MSTLFAIALQAVLSGAAFEAVVGENVRASSEEVSYVEPYVASHPGRSNQLVVAATRFSGGKPNQAVALTSSDGGSTWRESRLSTRPLEHAVDAWVAYSPEGIVYVSFLVIEPGSTATRIALFRSNDGGMTWTHSTTIRAERSFDRPTMIARGNEVVIVAEYAGGIAMLHSRDRGTTFGPARLLRPVRNLEHNAMNPLWHNGGVLVPYVDYGPGLAAARLSVVDTPDFGRSWSQPSLAADVPRSSTGNAHLARSANAIFMGVSTGTAEARTVSVASSRDGVAWSPAVRVSRAGAQAYRPAVAVTKLGRLGVTWIETENACTRLWFSHSADQGRTFSKAVPVSEDVSCGNTPANGEAFRRWEHGGDYFGLTAVDESFVAVWPDARGGTFQILSARIAIVPAP